MIETIGRKELIRQISNALETIVENAIYARTSTNGYYVIDESNFNIRRFIDLIDQAKVSLEPQSPKNNERHTTPVIGPAAKGRTAASTKVES